MDAASSFQGVPFSPEGWMCCLVARSWALGKSPAQQALDLEQHAPPFLPPPSPLSSFCTVVWTQVWPQGSWAEDLSMKHWCPSSGSAAYEERTPLLGFLAFFSVKWRERSLPWICQTSALGQRRVPCMNYSRSHDMLHNTGGHGPWCMCGHGTQSPYRFRVKP